MKLGKPFSRRSFVRAAGAGVLATALVGAGVAAAADPQAGSSDQAVPLVDRPLAGHLEGNSAGSFAYYKFDYPADGSVAHVNVQMVPDDIHLLQNAGIVIFSNNGTVLVSGGQQPKISPNVSGDVIFNDGNHRGSYVIQVYNYNPQTAMDFTIWVSGIPMPPASGAPAAAPANAPAAAPAPAPVATAVPASPPTAPSTVAPASTPTSDQPAPVANNNSFTGHLDAGGHTAMYEFTYPGDQSVYTVGANITPNNPTVMQNAGFKVYGPNGKVYVTGGYQGGLVPNVSGNIISRDSGTYVIQLYNYSSSPVDYTLSLQTSGPPGEIVASRSH